MRWTLQFEPGQGLVQHYHAADCCEFDSPLRNHLWGGTDGESYYMPCGQCEHSVPDSSNFKSSDIDLFLYDMTARLG